MALILNIETSTSVCSVALARDSKLLSVKEIDGENSHSSVITLFIDEVIKKAGVELSSLDAIAVSKGPGSYTGLRIGVSTAKGLCYAIDKPLIAVSTLQSMAYRMSKRYISKNPKNNPEVLFCPMIDARRMEVYAALYDVNNCIIRNISADIINKDSYSNFLEKRKVYFFGNGASKCKALLSHNKNAVFIDNMNASAVNMIDLAEKKYQEKDFEDLAYFEPFYLKDFLANKSKVKGLY